MFSQPLNIPRIRDKRKFEGQSVSKLRKGQIRAAASDRQTPHTHVLSSANIFISISQIWLSLSHDCRLIWTTAAFKLAISQKRKYYYIISPHPSTQSSKNAFNLLFETQRDRRRRKSWKNIEQRFRSAFSGILFCDKTYLRCYILLLRFLTPLHCSRLSDISKDDNNKMSFLLFVDRYLVTVAV